MPLPEELIASERFHEGARSQVTVNRYERDPRARAACLARWRYACVVCGFSFELSYGPIGHEFIHVHHLRELSTVGENYTLNPTEDLRPVCANCHAMLHRKRPTYTIEELQRLMGSFRSEA